MNSTFIPSVQRQLSIGKRQVAACASPRVPARAVLSHADPKPSELNRRELAGAAILTAAVSLLLPASQAQALGFQKEMKKRKLTDADYTVSDVFGLKFCELSEGKSGEAIKAGDKVSVHFDVMYRGIDVSSSRASRLLGGNRTIAEPFEFIAGEKVQEQAARTMGDSAGGLFSGQGGPKPPPVLSNAVYGMKKGGKRSVIVDQPALGYGDKGIGELPPGATFELRIEILEATPKAPKKA